MVTYCTCTEQWIAHLRGVNLIVCEFDLNKTAKKKTREWGIFTFGNSQMGLMWKCIFNS